MRLNLTLKISFTIILLLSFALGMISLLNYFKYEKTFSSLVQSRFVVLVLDLKNTLENSINLGLSLAEINNTQKIIERIAQQDEQIFSIDIFDQTGALLFRACHQIVKNVIL
ncbi:hypothetical protein [Beggiatoa leptomitoformis]|uniref:hypothetical protein n=1 Tax=Beggiatoa leptomitoformis TaxID=288004 RepID=UPI0007065BB3|nr:hypothetical protein [Beggiatoa leptomitoformis]ALG67942.1 hypothetical protein AL038_09755 [Beggiatoa leptomitoformis]